MKVTGMQIFDGNKLRQAIKDKGYKQKDFASMCGIGDSSLDKYLKEGKCQVSIYKLFCLSLGISESDLLVEEKRVSAADIINESKTLDEIAKLNIRLDALERDLHTMVRAIVECTKTSNEAKAQVDLNREQIEAVFNKCSDISSNVAKCYGLLNSRKKY